MDKLDHSRPVAFTNPSHDPLTKAIQALSPLDAAYTAHREAEQRRRATQDWLRQRESLQGRRL